MRRVLAVHVADDADKVGASTTSAPAMGFNRPAARAARILDSLQSMAGVGDLTLAAVAATPVALYVLASVHTYAYLRFLSQCWPSHQASIAQSTFDDDCLDSRGALVPHTFAPREISNAARARTDLLPAWKRMGLYATDTMTPIDATAWVAAHRAASLSILASVFLPRPALKRAALPFVFFLCALLLFGRLLDAGGIAVTFLGFVILALTAGIATAAGPGTDLVSFLMRAGVLYTALFLGVGYALFAHVVLGPQLGMRALALAIAVLARWAWSRWRARLAYDQERRAIKQRLNACGPSGEFDVVYCLCERPGHHAGPDSYGGYCLLNNAALAVEATLARGFARVALLDVDYHAGQGAPLVFKDRSGVLCVSVHARPDDEYPYFSGSPRDRRQGRALDFIFPPRASWDGYYASALAPALRAISRFKPTALVIAFGADTAKGDPEGAAYGCELLEADFERMGRAIAEAVRVPTVVTQEGGYALDAVGPAVAAFLRGLALAPPRLPNLPASA